MRKPSTDASHVVTSEHFSYVKKFLKSNFHHDMYRYRATYMTCSFSGVEMWLTSLILWLIFSSLSSNHFYLRIVTPDKGRRSLGIVRYDRNLPAGYSGK